MKVVFFVDTLKNPFIDAWYDFLCLLHIDFVILAQVNSDELQLLPIRIQSQVVYMTDHNWREQAEEKLNGIPDVIIYWWGLLSLLRLGPRKAWPKSSLSLVVDTFPNASMKFTLYLEVFKSFLFLNSVDLFIVTSEEMKFDMISTLGKIIKNKDFFILRTPFTLKSHSNKSVADAQSSEGNQSLVYLGRSDFLFSDNLRMRKDDTSRILVNFMEAGANIYLRESGNQYIDQILMENGFHVYKNHSRESMTNGSFSEFIDGFAGQIPIYNTHNSTIRRRVSNGLSTRFAQGVCSSTPMLLNKEAKFSKEFVEDYQIGLYIEGDISNLLFTFFQQNSRFRLNWYQKHHLWASEHYVDEFKHALFSLVAKYSSS